MSAKQEKKVSDKVLIDALVVQANESNKVDKGFKETTCVYVAPVKSMLFCRNTLKLPVYVITQKNVQCALCLEMIMQWDNGRLDQNTSSQEVF